jgi:hypothetical protein
MFDWKDNYDDDTADPCDGGEPITVWWEDMRPREVRALVKEVYARGCAAAVEHRGGYIIVDGEKWWSEEVLAAAEKRCRQAEDLIAQLKEDGQ